MGSNKPLQTNGLPNVGAGEKSESSSIEGDTNPKSAIPQGRPTKISESDRSKYPNGQTDVERQNFWQRLWKRVLLLGKVVVVIGAVGGIIQTIASIRSCQGTDKANDFSRDAAHRELTNYFDVEAKLITNQSGAKVKVSAKNASQSPARQVSIKVDDYWQPYPPQPKELGPGYATKMEVDDGQKVDVVPGGEIFLVHQVDASRIGRLRKRRMTLHTSVEITWTDADGNRQLKSYYFVQGGEHDPNAEVMSADE